MKAESQPLALREPSIGVLGLIALEGMGLARAVLLIPGDEKGTLYFGLSLARLLLVGFLCLGALAALSGMLAAWIKPRVRAKIQRSLRSRWLAPAALFLAVFAVLALLTPAWFGRQGAYFERLQPVFAWLGLVGIQGLALVWLPGFRERWRNELCVMRASGLLRPVGITALIFAVLWAIVAVTGIGLTPDGYYWNEAGVPVLGIQVLVSLFFVLTVNRLVLARLRPTQLGRMDVLLAIALWGFALLLWLNTPMLASYFAPGPYPPANEYYPYSDAALYDIAGQYVLLGGGLANGGYADKPLYSLFLGLLHALAGQSYQAVITLQVAVFAFLPVGLYFLGKQLFNRPAGLLTALLAAFQQRNAIAATREIQVSHSKLMMTEYPTAVALVFATLAALIWLKSPWRRRYKALTAGALFALAALIRPNALVPFALVVGIAVLAHGIQWRKGLLGVGIFVLSTGIVLAPWMLAVPDGATEPVLVTKLKAIFQTRYVTPAQEQTPPAEPTPTEQAFVSNGAAAAVSPLNSSPVQTNGNSPLVFVPRHFAHNELMAVLILPLEGQFKTLGETLQAPYWQTIATWTGELPWTSLIFLAFNLLILAIGIGLSWRRWRWAGLLPLAVQAGYFAANGLARNSGARYLVAVDWVELVYYSLGLLLLTEMALRLLNQREPVRVIFNDEAALEGAPQTGWKNWLRSGSFGALALSVAILIPTIGSLIPERYPRMSREAVLAKVISLDVLDVDHAQVETFLQDPAARAWIGRGIYPRFYRSHQGEPLAYYNGKALATPLQSRDYDRLTLTVLTPEREYNVVLPTGAVDSFPDGADVAVFGCWDNPDYYLDALAVVVLTDPPVVFTRDSQLSLTCPKPAAGP